MKLGLMIGYWQGGAPGDFVTLAREAENLGYESVWTAEAYGSDAFTPLAWIGANTSRIKLGTAVAQISARTPACVAMTATTLDYMSGGRLILGIGVSGPQVVEGWYGMPFAKPFTRTREFIEIVRTMIKREGPVSFDGQYYQLPYNGPGSVGLGKPLKLITHPLRDCIPIYLGAEGPKNVRLAADVADGWLPMFFSPYRTHVYSEALDHLRPGFEIACMAQVVVGSDVSACLIPVKWMLAFYIGGMGAKDKNFHVNIMSRMGFEAEVRKVQELFLGGDRAAAAEAVPDQLADEISLVGPPERIRERLQAWKESPVTQLLAGTQDVEALRVLAEAAA
ncbi:MAG TPA: LLM class F420-dependent oxidoreductase [Candidatus Limnocylindrales bacterium]|nr:LLM class F420-dependent oxidoreductase [Candidatus Limnocylindrales bacterium]